MDLDLSSVMVDAPPKATTHFPSLIGWVAVEEEAHAQLDPARHPREIVLSLKRSIDELGAAKEEYRWLINDVARRIMTHVVLGFEIPSRVIYVEAGISGGGPKILRPVMLIARGRRPDRSRDQPSSRVES